MTTIVPTADNGTAPRRRPATSDVVPGFDAALNDVANHLQRLAGRLDEMPSLQRSLLGRALHDFRSDLRHIRLDLPEVTR